MGSLYINSIMKFLKYYLVLIVSHVPRLSLELSGGSFVKTLSLTLSLWFFLFSRKTFYKMKPKNFHFVYKKRHFYLTLQSPVDVAALVEVFVLLEYKWDLPQTPKSILDLGAHWGDTATYYAIQYPDATVYSLEPSPSVFERLKMQVTQFPNVFPVQGALGKTDGEIDFYVSESTLGNSVIERSKNDRKISVPSFSLDELCRKAGVEKFDLIKFDIEGAEQFIFSDERAKSLGVAFIGEIHLDLMNYTIQDVKNYFTDFETTFEKINEQRYIIKASNNSIVR